MTAREQVARLARVLAAVRATRTGLWALAAGMLAFAVLRLLAAFGVVVPRPGMVAAVLVTAVAAGAVAYWRGGAAASPTRAALWVEEQVPGLDYALVTAADPRFAATAPFLAPRLRDIPWERLSRAAAVRALAPPLVVLLAASALLLVTPRGHTAAPAARAPGAGGSTATTPPAASPLARLRATVQPPAYTGLPATTLDDPASVAAVVASRVELRGAGEGSVAAELGGRAVAVTRDGRAWRLSLAMPHAPGALRLTSGGAERLVVLEPRADSAPVVTLARTVVDTVVRAPTGGIPLAGEATDDFGLASAAWEWIASSGEGENFTFRSGTLGGAALDGRRRAEPRATLSLDALELKPGDFVHVRLVARDRNTVSGPGVGVSETRTIRVARVGEYDSLAVEGAPPPEVDKSALSQRMLLLLTERLEERRPRLARATVVSESQAIARDQTALRKRVGELIYTRLGEGVDGEHSHFAGDGHEHGVEGKLDPADLLAQASKATGGGEPTMLDFEGDETPVVAVNQPLLEAYNHMWDASRELEVGAPGRAIAPMRRALVALQKAREAERIYLRGRPPAVVVDVARARLQGKDSAGVVSGRTPREDIDAAAAARARRLDRALLLLDAQPAAAVDSLLLLRVDALAEAPALAGALGDAIERLRGGRDATDALRRARRLADGEPHTAPGLPAWSGGGW
ncbi:MAG TPA: hypothetical protein VHQ45_10910 [Gemmatimonadaceae bacterium]|nr:hypothetical protein [Gemmatimonadaceae bacterium]